MLKNIFTYNFLKIFIYFLFIFSGSFKWIPIGIDLTLLTGALCVPILFFELHKKFNIEKKQKIIINSIILLCLFFLISNIYSISNVYAKTKSLAIIINAFSLLYPLVVFNDTSYKEYRLIIFCIGLTTIPVLLYMYFGNFFYIFHDSAEKVDKVPTYLVIGIMLATCFVVSLDFDMSLFMICYRVAILFLLLQLGGRGPLLNLSISLFLFYFIRRPKFNLNIKVVITIVIALVIAFLYFEEIIYSISNIDFRRFNFFAAYEEDGSFLARRMFLEHSIDFILNNPVYGYGIGSSGILLTGEDIDAYPHNLFIEAFLELGFIGAFLYLLAYICFFTRNYKMAKKHKSLAILYIISILFFLEDNKSGSFDSWRVSISWIAIFMVEHKRIMLDKLKYVYITS